MSGGGNDSDAGVRLGGKIGGEQLEFGNVAELVALAVDEEDRLAAFAQEREIIAALGNADGRADADEGAHAFVSNARFQPDARAEGETGEQERRVRVMRGEA